ncbi:MAG: efflux RND transporter periplasmic adaptor subunit [Stenotrophomonas sp.]
MRRITKPLFLLGLSLALCLPLLSACGDKQVVPAAGGRGPGPGPDGQRPPTPVRVAAAVREPLAAQIKALGTVTPLQSVAVRPRVDGELLRVVYVEGQYVEAGQLLAEIDPAPFRIQLSQAEGQQKQNLAELENVRIQLQRFRDLAGQAYVSAQDVSNLEAQVRQLEGRRQIDQAAVDDARLQLQYTRIIAPVAGRTGLRKVDAGNLVSSSDGDGIVSITQTHPISVLFSVPETALGTVASAVAGNAALPVQAWDREERQSLASGVLASVDNQIDTETGTLRLRAQFDNADNRLFPNQFVNVRLQLDNAEALVIPDAAVQFGNDGTYIYVVTAEGTATVRNVVLGAGNDGRVAVLEGVQAGEQVVLEGIDRLREGARVEVIGDDEAAPAEAGGAHADAGA